MESQVTHECSACGGTGDRFTDRDIPAGQECGATCSGPSGPPTYGGLICGAPATWRDTTKRTGDGGLYDSGDLEVYLCESHMMEADEYPADEPQPCPVCLGSGRVSDVRTARDAMVDAETLRLVAEVVRVDKSYHPQARAAAFTAYLWLIPAGEFGARAARYALEGWGAHGLAWDAARAAFRAVPALRGQA